MAVSFLFDNEVHGVQGLEMQCYEGANSKAVFRSVLANFCRAASKFSAESPELTSLLEPDTLRPASLPACASSSDAFSNALELWKRVEAAASTAALSATQRAVALKNLEAMLTVTVSRQQLAGGLGKKLKSLTKHADSAVSQAARSVVAAFKKQTAAETKQAC